MAQTRERVPVEIVEYESIARAVAAFAPSLFATPVVAGGTVTLWFLFAFGLIWTSVFVTGFYVLAVNAAEDRT